ncbi:MAG TPA: TolC family protein, partial [Polyangiales bacterium]
MRTELTGATRRNASLIRSLLGMGALLTLGACVKPSLRGDVREVRTLANAPLLPAVPPGHVDELEPREIDQLLAKPIDADQAVRIALLHNRELRARLRELGVERGQLMQAALIANPSVEAELSPERDSRVELRAEYDVMSWVMAPMRKRAAQHDLDAARLSVAGDVVELGFQVRSAFYALQAATQQLRVAQGTLEALAAGRDAAVALLEAGNLRALDAASQISAFERARISVAKLELGAAERREQLQRLLGLYGAATAWTLASVELAPLPEAPATLDNLEQRALRANLDLLATRSRLEAIAKRTGIARTEG